MSDTVPLPHRELLRARKERVHSTMLVEVLALLIFMAIAFAFALRDDALRTNPWKVEHDKKAEQLKLAQKEIRTLKRQVHELEVANRQLLRMHLGVIAANDHFSVSKKRWDELIARLVNAEAVIANQQAQNAAINAKLKGTGRRDLLNCPVSGDSYVVAIDLYRNSLRVTPKWSAAAAPAAAEVDGLVALADGRSMSLADFKRRAAPIKAWGLRQATPCGFSAIIYVRESYSTSILIPQQNIIDGPFYTAYRFR